MLEIALGRNPTFILRQVKSDITAVYHLKASILLQNHILCFNV